MIRFLLMCVCVSLFVFRAPSVAEAKTHPVIKPVKIVIMAVRYARYTLALKFFADDAQGDYLLEKEWAKGTDAQRAEFTKLFQTLFAKIALRKVHKQFKYLKTIVYGTPKITGDKAKLKATIVILHALKKQEMRVTFDLLKVKGSWRILDVTTIGDSMLTNLRNHQARKIMKKGGWKRLIFLLRKRAKQFEKIKIK